MSGIVLDTDIVIEILRGRNQSLIARWRHLAASETELLYTPITLAELWHGMRPKEEEATEMLLANLNCLPLTPEVGRLAGQYLQRFQPAHGVQLGDALIAAIASIYGCPLWTRNRKHYPMKDIAFF